MTATANANEIQITRVYDAPVALVWEAFTDLKHVAHWWGPRGFTLTTKFKELRAGGTWVYTMHGPDGKDWPNFTRYHEVVAGKRLVYDHGATSADAKPMFRVVVEFHDRHGKTELDMRMIFDTPELAQQTWAFVKPMGGNTTWDRFGEYLEKETSSKEVFLINRSFDAPIETMFDMWTKPEHFAKWLPPTGFTMQFTRIDIRTGGEGFYSMTNGQFTMYGRMDYLNVQRPHLIQYSQQFTDAAENIMRFPGVPAWPETMLTTVQLAKEGETATRVTVRSEVIGDATPQEIETFVAERGGMSQGWTGSFDKLDQLLAN